MCERRDCPRKIRILTCYPFRPMEHDLLSTWIMFLIKSVVKSRDTVSLLDCLNPNVVILWAEQNEGCCRNEEKERKAENHTTQGIMSSK